MDSPSGWSRVNESIRTRITSINIERIWWFCLIAGSVSVAYLIYNLVWWKHAEGFWVQAVDIGLTLLFLATLWKVRRMLPESAWRRATVWAFFFLMLVVMDVYYFAALPVVGHTASYVVGVMTTGVLLLLPFRIFLPALLINHAIYCVWLLLVREKEAVVPLLDGTAGVVIAAIAARFLYATTWSNLCKERVIEARNAELAASNTGLVTLNEEMNDLMAIAAHDLRSPLQGQKNLLELLRGRSNLGPEKTNQIMDTAIADCHAMLGLVSRLLEAHQAETLSDGMVLEPRDLRGVAQSVAAKAAPRASEKNIRLETVLPDRPAMARVHGPALEEVLENLVGNALKFSPPGTKVSLEICDGPGIVVRDEGPGIPRCEEGYLFRKFHRGVNRPTAGEPSTGMGLFIVKKLMEAMRGSVVCETGAARGTVFRLAFADAARESDGIGP